MAIKFQADGFTIEPTDPANAERLRQLALANNGRLKLRDIQIDLRGDPADVDPADVDLLEDF